jgi:hypothetical protein
MSTSEMNARLQQLANLGPAMARLREIVTQSQDALLTEGDVHPDHELLDLCATALHHLRHVQRALDKRNTDEWLRLEGAPLAAALAHDRQLMDACHEGNYAVQDRENEGPNRRRHIREGYGGASVQDRRGGTRNDACS